MVQRRVGSNQLAHHAVMPQVRRRDQRRAVVAAGDEPGAGTEREQGAQGFFIVGHRGDRDSVVAVVLPQAEIGAGRGERLDRLALARERGHMQWRAALAVAAIDVAAGQGLAHGDQVAAMGCRMQPAVGGEFGSARGGLGPRGPGRAEQAGKNEAVMQGHVNRRQPR